jgi:hypothetical protein
MKKELVGREKESNDMVMKKKMVVTKEEIVVM